MRGDVVAAVILAAVRNVQVADSPKTSAREKARVFGAWAGLLASVALLKILGFFVSFALLSVFLVYIIDRRSLITAATVGVGGALGFYLVFHLALGLSFPQGPWGF
jgi:hypothetical protein